MSWMNLHDKQLCSYITYLLKKILKLKKAQNNQEPLKVDTFVIIYSNVLATRRDVRETRRSNK